MSLPSAAYVKWEKTARAHVSNIISYTGPEVMPPYTGPIRVKAVYYYKGPRPDLSGCHESIGDCLEGYLWENDRQIERWHGESRLIHDKVDSRTEIEVEVL